MDQNKVTLEGIKSKIKANCYLVLPDGRTTICMLSLENGYTIKGISACVDPANFDLDLGRKYAYEDAIRQIWPLEGYLLAQRMYENPPVTQAAPSVLQQSYDLLSKEIEDHKRELAEIERTQNEWTLTTTGKGNMIAAVKKRGRPSKKAAPYGLKKDGTPAKKRGRPAKA